MTYSSPDPPQDTPAALVEKLDEQSPAVLREVARYAEELAEYREREKRLSENKQSEETEQPDDLPADVPSKATITIKEINDNRYYYWQWRDGEKIRSKYKGPVNAE